MTSSVSRVGETCPKLERYTLSGGCGGQSFGASHVWELLSLCLFFCVQVSHRLRCIDDLKWVRANEGSKKDIWKLEAKKKN